MDFIFESFCTTLTLNTEEKSLRPSEILNVLYRWESYAYAITKWPYEQNNLVAETLLPESFAYLFDPKQTFFTSRVLKNGDFFWHSEISLSIRGGF